MKNKIQYSFNNNSNLLVSSLIKNKEKLNIQVKKGPLGCTIIDAGANTNGSIEAGLRISEICLGGLGDVKLIPNLNTKISTYNISVYATHPVLSCLGCQYAGWSLTHKDFFSLGSGPIRSIVQKEEIFEELQYKDKAKKSSVILEVDKFPPKEIIKKISKDSKIKAENITLILTPTTSICGNLQVVARVLEVAIHKVHELNFPLDRIIHGAGFAPLPPIASDFLTGMGRTNDAIIYGGVVQLTIDGPESEIKELCKKLPSNNSKDYGKPFKQIFKSYKNDFYKIDGSLFSPAKVVINSKKSGKTYSSGIINQKLLEKSFS